jgi:hypothetical protein
MKITLIMAACAITLSGCGAGGGNSSAFLNNGNDVSFLRDGANGCPGVNGSANPIFDRYPLRCGPQTQGCFRV